MNDPMMQDMGFHGFFMWGLLIVIVTLGVALTVFFLRRVSDTRLPIEGWASKDRGFQKWAGRASAPRDLTPHETVFVLPDISHYTRFMAGTHFSFGHAQHIVLSLLDAMIEAATQTLELSKLEGAGLLVLTGGTVISSAGVEAHFDSVPRRVEIEDSSGRWTILRYLRS